MVTNFVLQKRFHQYILLIDVDKSSRSTQPLLRGRNRFLPMMGVVAVGTKGSSRKPLVIDPWNKKTSKCQLAKRLDLFAAVLP